MSEFGFKVAKPDYDVKTTSLLNLALTSQKNLFKVSKSGTWQISLTSSYFYDAGWDDWFYKWIGSTTITHSLGHVPGFEVWGQSMWDSGNYQKWFGEIYIWWGNPRYKIIEVSSTTLVISYEEILRDDLYVEPERTTLNGIYSLYLDPLES